MGRPGALQALEPLREAQEVADFLRREVQERQEMASAEADRHVESFRGGASGSTAARAAVPVPAAWEPAGTGGSAPGARWTVRRGRLRR